MNIHNNTNNSLKPSSALPNSAKYFKSKARDPLADEEKVRRKKLNLYTYCSDPKHSVADCLHIEAKANTISLPPPCYPQPLENSQPQAPTRI